MSELSIIIPYVNEYPQIMFTIQNLMCELDGRVDYEIIAINNYIHWPPQCTSEDKGFEVIGNLAQRHGSIFKSFHYKDKLSHWNAKNFGIQKSTGKYLFFCDGHCLVGRDCLYQMFNYYKQHEQEINGTLHLPISYMLEKKGWELIYKPVIDLSKGELHYTFSRYRPSTNGKHYQVPCMSTCGMMISKKLMVEELNMWPTEMGIYGGGENFVNYSLAVMGYNINIFPKPSIFHYAEARGYRWIGSDWNRNRLIAMYIACGEELAELLAKDLKGSPETNQRIFEEVVIKCDPHREHIKKRTRVDIFEWANRWKSF